MTSTEDPQQLAEEIERTRAQLGETVEALTAKTDIRAMAQAKANQFGTRLKDKANQARQQASQQMKENPVPLAVSASAAMLVVLFIMGWRRQ